MGYRRRSWGWRTTWRTRTRKTGPSLVRGHYRRMSNGKIVWVSPHMRRNSSLPVYRQPTSVSTLRIVSPDPVRPVPEPITYQPPQQTRPAPQRLDPTDHTAYIISSVLALVCLAGLLALLT
jgi:hypothetical protein